MSITELRADAVALRATVAEFGERLAAQAAAASADELFELTGELQAVANAVEGAQLVAIAHAGSHETRLTERGPVEVHHEVGFIDAMTSPEVSLATGLGQWAAGRKVGLAEALTSRFTKLLGKVLTGELATVNASKVVAACDGLDDQACAAVEEVLVERVVGMDPARITTVARKVATRIAADQVAAAAGKNRRDRCVQVSPGPDGTTDWWARLPAGRSAAAWAAIRELGDEYAGKDPALTLDQARADAFMDLLLTNVTVTAKVTLGIPVITGPEGQAARDAAVAERLAQSSSDGASAATGETDTDTQDAADTEDAAESTPATGDHPGGADTTDANGEVATERPASSTNDLQPVASEAAIGGQANGPDDATAATCTTTTEVPATGADATAGTWPATTDISDPAWVRPAVATGGLGLGGKFSLSAALLSGCEIPGIGFIDADTVEALLTVVPTDIGRALLDARTGTLMESVSTAYRPSKAVTDFVTTRDGTCRMWGCNRPATHCDIDHARPWPNGPTTPTNLGGLCRRHHRLKQRRRWTYQLAPDGTATWTSPTGRKRITQPDHAALPPPLPALPVPATTPQRQLVAVEPPPF